MPKQPVHTKYTPTQIWPLFVDWLPAQVVERLLAKQPRRFYQRLFPPLVVLWGFIYQRLNADHTCDAFVSYLNSSQAAELHPAGGRPRSENTAAYCKARQRLPLEVAWGALAHTAQAVSQALGTAGRWHGRRVCLLDGSTLRLQAEPELIAQYGLPRGRHGASHWPRLRAVVAFDLYSGAVVGTAEGPYGCSELRLAQQLLRRLAGRQVIVGDQGFGIYALVQAALAGPHDVVLRIQAGHVRRWTQAPLPSGSDVEVVWQPSPADQCAPDWPTPAVRGRLIYVCLQHPGFRPIPIYLFTTLLDREAFPAAEILQLYARRWQVELDLRHVKTTLEMEQLDGKSVDIVRKEWLLGLLAYNLIRGLMGQAALRAGLSPLQLSLARGWRRIADTARALPASPTPLQIQAVLERLLQRLAACRLPQRKTMRFEPRAVWARPHQYPYLSVSRAHARQVWIEKLKQKS